MNIPNYLTLSRIVIAFLCMAFMLWNNLFSLVTAFLLFILASFTDFLDGFIARRYNKVSDLGKLFDPIADKILILGVFLAFLALGIINIWMVIIIMTREFIITGVRLFAINKGYILGARRFGKHKTASQMIGVIYIFAVLILRKMLPESTIILFLYDKGVPLLMWYIVIVTAFSGIHYLWVNRRIIKNF